MRKIFLIASILLLALDTFAYQNYKAINNQGACKILAEHFDLSLDPQTGEIYNYVHNNMDHYICLDLAFKLNIGFESESGWDRSVVKWTTPKGFDLEDQTTKSAVQFLTNLSQLQKRGLGFITSKAKNDRARCELLNLKYPSIHLHPQGFFRESPLHSDIACLNEKMSE